MKVMHVYKSYYPDTLGGIEKSIAGISAVTANLGCDNHLLTTSSKLNLSSQLFPGLRVHYFPQTLQLASCPLSWQAFTDFKVTISDADIIHYHFPWPFADLLHLSHHINKPSIITYHSDIIRQRVLKYAYTPLMHAFLKKVDCIVPTSPNLFKNSRVLQKFSHKCQVIPLGIDTRAYQHTIDRKQIQALKVQFGGEFFLFLGVLRYYKGLHLLIEAASDTTLPIVIAGDGPEKEALIALTKKRRLSNIYFLGKISETHKVALLQACRAVVLPSHLPSEAFGISLLEGLLFAKPLISTELGTGTSYVNQDGKTGLVIKPNDSAALNAALLKLANNDQLVQQMRANAKLRFTEQFNIDVIGQQYFHQYQLILNNANKERVKHKWQPVD